MVPLTREEIEKYKTILLDIVPKDGITIGNKAARTELKNRIQKDYKQGIEDKDYWDIRDALLAMTPSPIGVRRGGGGAIYLLSPTTQQKTALPDTKYKKESDLYEPVLQYIRNWWVKDYRIERYVNEITAHKGNKDTGGKWTRPDITLFAVRQYPFIPGKTIELISFEIKPKDTFDIQGVFETASHSVFAHRSYLMIHMTKDPDSDNSDVLDRISRECERFGIGFITFTDPKDWDTYKNRQEAEHKNPDPDQLCDCMQALLSKDTLIEIYTRLLKT